MSRVDIQGGLPAPRTVLSVIDTQAQIAAKRARDVVVDEEHHQAPRSGRSGPHLADQFTGRVSKTKIGWQVIANFGRTRDHRGVTAAKVARWVTRGTGIYREGPGPKKRIRAKNRLHRLNLGGGTRRWSVAGQRPNQFIQRTRETAHERAMEQLRAGAIEAARILRGERGA